MTTEVCKFRLVKDGKDLGGIVWVLENDEAGYTVGGSFDGDAAAVAALNGACAKAVAEKWKCATPTPDLWEKIIESPADTWYEMLAVLEQAGFDTPAELLPFWEALRGTDDPPEGGVY